MDDNDTTTPRETTSDDMKRIVVIDDHPMMREAVIETLDDHPDWDVCGQAEDVSSALETIEREQPALGGIDRSQRVDTGAGVLDAR